MLMSPLRFLPVVRPILEHGGCAADPRRAGPAPNASVACGRTGRTPRRGRPGRRPRPGGRADDTAGHRTRPVCRRTAVRRRGSGGRRKLWRRSRTWLRTDTPGIGAARDGWHTRGLTPIAAVRGNLNA